MSRALTPAIISALGTSGAEPTLTVTARGLTQLPGTWYDGYPNVPPYLGPLPVQLATFGGTPSLKVHATLDLDTTNILVTRTDPTAADTPVQLRVITDPTDPTQWDATPIVIAPNAFGLAGCRIAAEPGHLRAFYQRPNLGLPCYRDSIDGGRTWGLEFVLGNGTDPLLIAGSIIDDFIPLTPNAVFVVARAFTGLLQGASALCYTALSGSWSPWTYPLAPAGNHGQIHSAEYLPANPANPAGGGIFLAGIARRNTITGLGVAAWTWDGTTHSDPIELQSQDNPHLGLSYAASAAGGFGAGSTTYALVSFTDDGSVSTSPHRRARLYSRTDGAITQHGWHELCSFPQAAAGIPGSALLRRDTHLYVISGTAVWWLDPGPAETSADLTPEVLQLHVAERLNQPARATLILSNQGNQYSADGAFNPLTAIDVALGYGGDAVPCWRFYVEDLAYVRTGADLTCRLALVDSGILLERVSERVLLFAGATVDTILEAIAAQLQLPLSHDATTVYAQTVPCFTIKAGEPWVTALNRLTEIYDLGWRITAAPVLAVTNRDPGNPSTWTYGPETLGAEWGLPADVPTIYRVIGADATAWSEVQSDAHLRENGRYILQLVVDRQLTTAGDARLRAQQEAKRADRLSSHAQLTITINPTHELDDKLTIGDPTIGTANTAMRIAAIDTTIDWRDGHWMQQLQLDAP